MKRGRLYPLSLLAAWLLALVPIRALGDDKAYFRDLSCRGARCCVLSFEGQVTCWGLAEPTSHGSVCEDAASVAFPEPGVALASEDNQVCIETRQGKVYCQRDGGPGRAGFVSRVEAITAATGIRLLTSGSRYMFGIHRSGRLLRWEAEYLDLGTYSPLSLFMTDLSSWLAEDGRDVVRKLEATWFTRCLLYGSGGLWCWSDEANVSDFDWLGTETSGPRRVPVADVMDVFSGPTETCALRADRDLYCWGYGLEARKTTWGTRSPIVEPMVVASGVARAVLGYGFRCVQFMDQSWQCRGDPSYTSGTQLFLEEHAEQGGQIETMMQSVCVLRADTQVACKGKLHVLCPSPRLPAGVTLTP